MSLSHLKYPGCDPFNFTRQYNAAQQNKSNQLLLRFADSNINTYFAREFRENNKYCNDGNQFINNSSSDLCFIFLT